MLARKGLWPALIAVAAVAQISYDVLVDDAPILFGLAVALAYMLEAVVSALLIQWLAGDKFEHLEKLRWPDGPYCPRCGETKKVKRLGGKAGEKGQVMCNPCRKKFMVSVGTLFERKEFEAVHRQRYGFIAPEKEVILETLIVETCGAGAVFYHQGSRFG